jgi:hypothetical protein
MMTPPWMLYHLPGNDPTKKPSIYGFQYQQALSLTTGNILSLIATFQMYP